mgnify:CR=1 FL=1
MPSPTYDISVGVSGQPRSLVLQQPQNQPWPMQPGSNLSTTPPIALHTMHYKQGPHEPSNQVLSISQLHLHSPATPTDALHAEIRTPTHPTLNLRTTQKCKAGTALHEPARLKRAPHHRHYIRLPAMAAMLLTQRPNKKINAQLQSDHMITLTLFSLQLPHGLPGLIPSCPLLVILLQLLQKPRDHEV